MSPYPRRPFTLQWALHVVAMASLAAVIGYQLYVEYGRTGTMERERLLNQARVVAKNLSFELEATYQALLGIRADPDHWGHAAGRGLASARLKTLADAMPGVRTITVLNADGVVMTSNRADLIGENFSKRPYFETARRLADPDILVVSPPFRTSLGVFAMNLVMMIPGGHGEFAGVVSTTLDPDYFTTLLGSVLYAPDMWSALAHDDGLQFLMVPDRPGQGGKDLRRPGTFFQRHQDSGLTESVLTGIVYATGEERMMAQITIRPANVPVNKPLTAAISRDIDAIYGRWRQDALKQAGLYLLLLIATSTGLYVFHWRQRAFDRNLMAINQALEEARHLAEAASRAKSAFLATMSHEIRTPITGVLGMADLLRGTALTAEQAGYVEALTASTRSLLTILNDILDISKIEAGRVTLESVAFSPHRAAEEVVAFSLGAARAKGLTLTLDIRPEVPAAVIGDPTKLKQIFYNLISNAVKFTAAGTVSVRLSVHAREAGTVTLRGEVDDTGIGIAGAETDRLFRAFSQVDPSTTRRFGGTGLGLAITKGLVDMMGGEAGVDSEPGQGSRFWVLLPFGLPTDAEPLPAEPEPEPLSRSPRPLRILLAEDNRINQMLVRAMLVKLGHSVTVVDNGRLALAEIAAHDFDAVLMDMQMPEMDGEEATRAIRELPAPKGRLPVLALTADVMPEHRERYRAAGINDLVTKPIDWRQLCAVLEALTGPGAR
ncbi:MAG: ATP-binding protein [Rhodospirillaceae bacterium]